MLHKCYHFEKAFFFHLFSRRIKNKMGEVEEEGQERSTDPSLPIQKKVLHAGKGEVPDYKDGTKVNIWEVL
jgi:hypothetical protein